MRKSNVIELEGRDASLDPLTELLRTGGRQLIQQAVAVELQDLIFLVLGRIVSISAIIMLYLFHARERLRLSLAHLNLHMIEQIRHQ
jgi:hypothetical protein